MTDDWIRRYEANAKVPNLPADDYDFDRAMSELTRAVSQITGDSGLYTVGNVIRILRHQKELAAQLLHNHEPTCLNCGSTKHCLGCDDTRPRADQLAAGWQFWSPLQRWETVTHVTRDNEYAPLRVFTDKTGPDYSYRMTRHTRIDATAKPFTVNGKPEIRIVEYTYDRTAPMQAVITLDTIHRPDTTNILAEAHHQRGTGWVITDNPAGGDTTRTRADTKAKARTVLRTAARDHAKALRIEVAAYSPRNQAS